LIGVHLFAVAVTVVCVVAGSWQLDAYQAERAAERADRSGSVPVPVDDLVSPDQALTGDVVGRRVMADGTYAPAEQQLLVAGRQVGGANGWWVLSPLLVDADTALLVVRGWTGEQRLPPVPSGPVSVTVSLQPGEDAANGARLTPAPGEPVVDVVRLPSLVNTLPYRLYPAYGIRTDQSPAPTDGLEQVSAPGPQPSWSTGSRNLAYGLQWWAFGVFALFMWWRVVVDRVRPSPPPEAPAATP
jgi:cytochrome oxidase assembly protein ShyY1